MRDAGVLLTHIVTGSLALVVGPIQLWSGLRRRSLLLHRWAELGALRGLGSEPVAVLVWLSWGGPLLALEIVLQRRDVFRR